MGQQSSSPQHVPKQQALSQHWDEPLGQQVGPQTVEPAGQQAPVDVQAPSQQPSAQRTPGQDGVGMEVWAGGTWVAANWVGGAATVGNSVGAPDEPRRAASVS